MKEIYADHKEHEKSKSGTTSWGYTWEWAFGCPVELKALDGHRAMATDIHTLDSGYNFEDEQYDRSYSLSPAQDTEWDNICWDCYLTECEIYDLIQADFRAYANQLIQDYKAENLNVTHLPDDDFSDMLAACLDAVKQQQNWDKEESEWLFNYGGPINSAVEMWLTDVLERHNIFS